MISIREVAERAGVSPSTVSRVLSGNARVEPATRARVEAVIRETGYRPNANAQGLRSRSGRLIGLVLPDTPSAFSSIIAHAEEEAYRMGSALIVANTGDDPERERAIISDLLSRNVDAIIFSRVSDASHVEDAFRGRRVPIVAIDRGIELPSVPSVQVHNERAGRLVAQLFAGDGHTDVGLIMGPQNIPLARERTRGFVEGLAQYGVEVPVERRWEGPFAFETGVSAAEEVLKGDRLPTAVWAHSDVMAVGFMHRLLKEGVRIPTEVAVAGMDNAEISRMVYPPLTTVNQPMEELCSRAFALIRRQIDEGVATSEHILIDPVVVLRASYH